MWLYHFRKSRTVSRMGTRTGQADTEFPKTRSLLALGFILTFWMEQVSEFPQEHLSKYMCVDSH